MIALQSGCLLFKLADGESIPCAAEMVTVEIIGCPGALFDPELIQNATASVFHYFRHELKRETVTVGEFAGALEKVLCNLGFIVSSGGIEPRETIETDLGRLAREAAGSLELFFFPRLRDELRARLRQSPRVLRFRGLRGCVKQVAGARRWSARCDRMRDQIVGYLRECLVAEPEQNECSLVVE
jgi:hypothetical protein